jgi:hypothetical protein
VRAWVYAGPVRILIGLGSLAVAAPACSDDLAAPGLDAGHAGGSQPATQDARVGDEARAVKDAESSVDARAPEDAGGVPSDAAAPAADAGASCSPCAEYGPAGLLATVDVPGLAELSGISASPRNPGVLFAHNDRARAEVFALGEQGELRARFSFENAQPVDVEDIAVGVCPAGSCLYLADIGDNASQRGECAILRSAEPQVDPGVATDPKALEYERFRFAYEDGAHNAEGILIDPGSGVLYVVTKLAAGVPSSVYELGAVLDPGGLNVARKVAELSVPRPSDMPATAASASPCGRGFLLRTGNALYEYRIAAGTPFASAFALEPVAVPAGDEPQSEAVSYWPDGRGYVSSGEGASAPIYTTRCR